MGPTIRDWMTATRSAWRRLTCVSGSTFGVWLLAAVCSFNFPGTGDTPSEDDAKLSFVQFTDVHLFDEGTNQLPEDALRQAADDRTALRWAIQQVNEQVARGKKFDLVVYTGDLGLENIELPADGTCSGTTVQPKAGLPTFTTRSAAYELASLLDQLVVRRIVLMPGNNDLVDENVTDNDRFECFIAELRRQQSGMGRPLEVIELSSDVVLRVGGFTLLGLNSASFKKAGNYLACYDPQQMKGGMLNRACPENQINALARLVDLTDSGPLVLFTHVPDLMDPYRKKPAWDLTPALRKVWEQKACGPGVVAIFAGHFHDSSRAIYGSSSGSARLAVSPCVADKTWVSPPLAAKYQWDKRPQARGFLEVELTRGRQVQAYVHWFRDGDQGQESDRRTIQQGTNE